MSSPDLPKIEPIHDTSSGGGGLKIAVLFGLVLALGAATAYLYMQLQDTRAEMTKTRDALLGEIDKVREATSLTSQSHRRTTDSLKVELANARRLAASAAGQAKIDANKHADELAEQLAKETQQRESVLKADISKVDEKAVTANSKIGEVKTEVGTVKTEVASTKSELEKTVANLRRVTGDVSGQASLIATNSTELGALKALGERNYFEFKLSKTKDMQKVGDVAVQLKKIDVKKNRYTIELLVDDKRVEKRDKTVNEPVQFITTRAKQPYEIVVNDIKKDTIAGYLATPKVQSARN